MKHPSLFRIVPVLVMVMILATGMGPAAMGGPQHALAAQAVIGPSPASQPVASPSLSTPSLATPMVTAGYYHTVGLKSDGTVVAAPPGLIPGIWVWAQAPWFRSYPPFFW